MKRAALTLLAALALTACGTTTTVVNPVTGRAERTVMDEKTELAEGAKAHQQILAETPPLNNPALQAYVNSVGQKLAAQSHRAQLKWTFTVLDSPEVNAFALPGGYVYITRGIMAYLNDEAELAGVLGHEIGHVTARHGAQRATSQQRAGVGVAAATVLGVLLEGVTGVSGVAQATQQVSQGVALGKLASYSREQESQADELGAEYLSRNRYNPRNMIEVIQVLKNQERFAADQARAEGRAAPQGANWLSSHPSNDKRLADIQQVATRYTGSYDDDGRARYLKAIEGMPYGDSPDQGVVRGRQFFHEGLEIALVAPQGWRIQNGTEAITVANSSGDAALIVRLLPPKAGTSHDEVIRNVIKPLDGRVDRLNLNGMQATHFTGAIRDAQGGSRGVQATLVTGPGGRIYLMQYAAKDPATLQRHMAPMQETEASFHVMTPADRAAAKPFRVRAVPMPLGGFAELARNSSQSEAVLRLVNGVYGGGTDPRPGTTVKQVQ